MRVTWRGLELPTRVEKDEAVLLKNLLYDLRMRYVNETKNIEKAKED